MSHAAPDRPLTIDSYGGLDGLASIEGEWRALLERIPATRFYHQPGWHRSFLTALLGPRQTLLFHVVRAAGTAVAIVPLVTGTSRRWGMRVRDLSLPVHLHPPIADILLAPGTPRGRAVAAVERGLRASGARWDTLRFRSVPAGSVLFRATPFQSWRSLLTQAGTSDHIRCDQSFDRIAEGFSRRLRNSLAQGHKRLAREPGEARFAVIDDVAGLRRDFAAFLELEASGWKGHAGSAVAQHPRLVRFYESVMAEFAPTRSVLLASLRLGERPVAMQFCLRDPDVLHVVKIAYDESLARLAPGNLLMEHTLRHAASEAARFVEIGDPAFSADWQPVRVPKFDLHVFNRTPVGMALLGGARLKRWGRRARRGADGGQTRVRPEV